MDELSTKHSLVGTGLIVGLMNKDSGGINFIFCHLHQCIKVTFTKKNYMF